MTNKELAAQCLIEAANILGDIDVLEESPAATITTDSQDMQWANLLINKIIEKKKLQHIRGYTISSDVHINQINADDRITVLNEYRCLIYELCKCIDKKSITKNRKRMLGGIVSDLRNKVNSL